MRTVLNRLFQGINEQDFPYSLSSKLDASRQPAQQGRGNLVHPC